MNLLRVLKGRQMVEWSSYTTRIQTLGEKRGIHQSVPFSSYL